MTDLHFVQIWSWFTLWKFTDWLSKPPASFTVWNISVESLQRFPVNCSHCWASFQKLLHNSTTHPISNPSKFHPLGSSSARASSFRTPSNYNFAQLAVIHTLSVTLRRIVKAWRTPVSPSFTVITRFPSLRGRIDWGVSLLKEGTRRTEHWM